MKLSSAVENYVALKRSLGAVFSVDARILRSFTRVVGDVGLEVITPDDCRKFCRGKGLSTRFWERKHGSLCGFFRYLVSRRFLASSPFQEPAPRIQHTFRPYIYSHDELRRLLEAISQEKNHRRLLEPETLRMIILLLYGAGLRAGEALRLRPCDINFQDRVLSILGTKFFKSRLLPIHGPACVVLGFRHGRGLPVLVHVVSQRARGLRLRGAAARTRAYRPCWCCLPPVCTGSAPRICNFSKLDTQPADASVYASVAASRRLPQNSRSGWFATPFL